ncbi:MAG: tRNA (guanosine(37)-N1)-methyltransferase TrmD [Magnetococcales bacterium]|nr:tRNA (guanosine(37)-N1)-methyltransferase TrmD [Magnetococcales bacterium]
MKFSILTLFPEMFEGLLSSSILARAQRQELIEIERVQIRDFAIDRHNTVDDYSFGGGPGMVMKADVLERALSSVYKNSLGSKEQVSKSVHVVYLSPQGVKFSQDTARRFARLDHLILICGHYEGIDERFVETFVDEELSIGDFVLTGGEIPAMAVVDGVARLRPGVIGDAQSFRDDSFYGSLLDHPHYTRPAKWTPDFSCLDSRQRSVDKGAEVVVEPPAALLSGDHMAVVDWRRRQSLLRTLIRRPDLLDGAGLTKVEKRLLDKLAKGLAEDLGRAVF